MYRYNKWKENIVYVVLFIPHTTTIKTATYFIVLIMFFVMNLPFQTPRVMFIYVAAAFKRYSAE